MKKTIKNSLLTILCSTAFLGATTSNGFFERIRNAWKNRRIKVEKYKEDISDLKETYKAIQRLEKQQEKINKKYNLYATDADNISSLKGDPQAISQHIEKCKERLSGLQDVYTFRNLSDRDRRANEKDQNLLKQEIKYWEYEIAPKSMWNYLTNLIYLGKNPYAGKSIYNESPLEQEYESKFESTAKKSYQNKNDIYYLHKKRINLFDKLDKQRKNTPSYYRYILPKLPKYDDGESTSDI